MANSLVAAQRWFDAGIADCQHFSSSWKRARAYAINAGFNFAKARDCVGNGEWGDLLEQNREAIKPRTVQFFMQLAEAALEWARAEQPKLPTSKLQEFATSQVMLMSPKPLVALLRDLREMRPFGEYDAVKYAQKKLGHGQLELDFEKISSSLDLLTHFGEANVQLIFPEGKDQEQALAEVETKLETALLRVREMKRGVIET